MRIACWISKATNTYSGHVILFVFPLQRCLHERVSMLRYTYIPSMFICINKQKQNENSHRPYLSLLLTQIFVLVCIFHTDIKINFNISNRFPFTTIKQLLQFNITFVSACCFVLLQCMPPSNKTIAATQHYIVSAEIRVWNNSTSLSLSQPIRCDQHKTTIIQ